MINECEDFAIVADALQMSECIRKTCKYKCIQRTAMHSTQRHLHRSQKVSHASTTRHVLKCTAKTIRAPTKRAIYGPHHLRRTVVCVGPASASTVPVNDASHTVLNTQPAIEAILPVGLDVKSFRDMKGKVVLVTGSARGIGFNTSRLLAALGATVYMADIDNQTLMASAEAITQQLPGSDIRLTPRLDLGSTESVHAWCDAWLSGQITGKSDSTRNGQPPKLDVLVNNAGANFMGVEPWYTNQQVAGLPQVNYVGPYTLTRRLLPSLWSAADDVPRVVNVASVMHRFSELPQDPSFFLQDWWKGGAYRNCKHANVVFTLLLQQAAQQASRPLTCVAVDPGAVYSNIWATSKVFGKPPGSTIIKALFATPEDACATSVMAAAGKDVQGGQYWARGLFARSAITRMPWEPAAGLVSCLDWPLRNFTAGRIAAGVKAAPIAPKALAAVDDGRGIALWDAAAKLAGLPCWEQGLVCSGQEAQRQYSK